MKTATRAASRWRRPVELVVMVVVGVFPAWWVTPRALADSPVPNPDPQEPPGGELMGQILGWLKWGALWAAVAAMLIGAIAVGVGHFGSNYGASSSGRKWLLGGITCAAVAGLAWTFANTVYSSTT